MSGGESEVGGEGFCQNGRVVAGRDLSVDICLVHNEIEIHTNANTLVNMIHCWESF